MKKVLIAILSLMLMMSLCTNALAAGSVTYDGNSRSFIFAPGSDESVTDLFPEFKNVMPGDKITQKILVKNDADKEVKVNIYLRSLGAQEGSEEFLSQLRMTVSKSAENAMGYMFDAAADKTDGLTDWVLLGTLYSGGEVNLDVTLEVPIELGDDFQNAVGYIDWQFRVEELPAEEGDPEPPKTGDDFMMPLFISLLCISALAVIVLIAAKHFRRKDK